MDVSFFTEEKEGKLGEAQRYQDMVGAHFTSFGRVVLSDYIPYLSFITKWRGTAKEMMGIAQNIYDTLDDMIELDARRKARAEQAEQEADHRPRDFVDVLMSTPSHDGSGPLDDFTIRVVVLVNLPPIDCHIFIFFSFSFCCQFHNPDNICTDSS